MYYSFARGAYFPQDHPGYLSSVTYLTCLRRRHGKLTLSGENNIVGFNYHVSYLEPYILTHANYFFRQRYHQCKGTRNENDNFEFGYGHPGLTRQEVEHSLG